MMSEKVRVLMRYLLEQPSFGRDGHVPPDVSCQPTPPFGVSGTEEEQQNHAYHANERCDVKDTTNNNNCLLYTSPSPRYKRQSRMPSSA